MPLRIRSAVIALAGLTSACATAYTPPLPVLEYARENCDASPALASAISLTPRKETASFMVTAPVGPAAPCLVRGETRGPYIVYALPADIGDKTLTVGGVLEAGRIFSPDVSLLDSEGRVTRTFDRESYLYRGLLYSVQFRPRSGEAFVLVAADPVRVGQRYDAINIGVNTTSVYAAGVMASWSSGMDSAQSRTFSYEGSTQVVVLDNDTKEDGASPQ